MVAAVGGRVEIGFVMLATDSEVGWGIIPLGGSPPPLCLWPLWLWWGRGGYTREREDGFGFRAPTVHKYDGMSWRGGPLSRLGDRQGLTSGAGAASSPNWGADSISW